jgi:hypothetical protein
MKLLCWNIKQFTTNKVNSPTVWGLIGTVLQEADVAVILECPASADSAVELTKAVVAKLGTSWKGDCVCTPAMTDGESESVIVVWNKNQADVTGLQCANIPGFNAAHRSPVLFQMSGDSDVQSGKVTRNVMAWHAPSNSLEVGPEWAKIKPWDGLAAAPIDVICGDFNSNVVSPYNYADAAPLTDGTMIANPNLSRGVGNVADIYSSNRYDRFFVRKGVPCLQAGKLNPARRVLGTQVVTASGRASSSTAGPADAHKVAFAASDHAPMRISL